MTDKLKDSLPALLEPGHHSFISPSLTFTYVVRGDHYISDGASTNRLVLVQCPGWGLGSSYLQAGLAPLEGQFSLLYFNPRGTGGSEKPENGAEMDSLTMAEDIEFLRLHLSLEKFPAILGHSNGGTIALAYAEKFPDRVGKLILLDHRVLGLELDPPNQSSEEEEDETMPSEMRAVIDQKLTDAWVKVLPRYFFAPAASVPKFRSTMGASVIDGWCLAKQKKYDRQPALGEWMLAHIGNVKAKVLLIFGKQDIVCPVANAERTMRDIEHVEMTLLDGCGHFPWIEKEAETLERISSFMQASA